MRDVILVRRVGDVHVDATESANFANNLTLPIAGSIVTATSTRGWTAVDVVAKKRGFRFVNTHLESFSNTVRSLQAQELWAGPLVTSLPVVLVGDLNSASDDPVFDEGTPLDNMNPYDILIGAGFIDTWLLVHPSVPGNTCCQDADLRNAQSKLFQRIDHVLITDGDAYRSNLLGNQPSDRTRSGLWPSDHAGVTPDVAR
jgi:endonuclease/exonuclease/phosphatase family metal-dependent hydrolase